MWLFLGFTALPPPKVICNSPSVFSHAELVFSHIRDLCLSGAIEKALLASLVVVSPLGVVPKKNGKLRLILDLRYVNQFQRICISLLKIFMSFPSYVSPSALCSHLTWRRHSYCIFLVLESNGVDLYGLGLILCANDEC